MLLGYILKYTNKKLDVVAFTETRITRYPSKQCNISLKNYTAGSTPSESSGRGTFLYIANHLSYKLPNDLNI